jgi:arylsulfatase A-like enzyme
MPALTEGKTVSRELVWNGKAIRDGDWKLIVDGKGQSGVGLYNLKDDLSEQKNLANEHPERVADLQQRLKHWQREMEETMTKQP